jgi:hypothetical protein
MKSALVTQLMMVNALAAGRDANRKQGIDPNRNNLTGYFR